VLTLALSYLVFWGPLALFQVTAVSFVDSKMGPPWAIALYILGGFVPSGVAVALIGLREGRAGLGRLGRRMTQFRIGWRLYLAAVAIVAFGTAGQIELNSLLGHAFNLSLFVVQVPTLLPLLVLGPLSEELGWRGYAQDRLQARFSPQVTAVIVGTVWAFWHLPLFLMPGTSQHELGMHFTGFLVGTISVSLMFAWLHNHTGGSVWAAIFFHWIYTYAAQVVATGITRSPLYNWLEYAPYVLAAALVALVWSQEGKRRISVRAS
jgi:uncharacterized protein